MYVNIPVQSHGSVIGMEVDTAAFDPQHLIQRDRSIEISGMDQSLLQSST